MKEGEAIPQEAKVIDITERIRQRREKEGPAKTYDKAEPLILFNYIRDKKQKKAELLRKELNTLPSIPVNNNFLELIKDLKKDKPS